jgi:hypothetical protein
MRILAFALAGAASTALLGAQQPSQSIELPSGARIVLEAKGKGVQIYTCARANSGFKWTLKAPDAKLLDANGKEIGIHFAGPTWKLTDGSQVQGEVIANRPSPIAGSVPWLLLKTKAGTATGSLADVAFIRRSETHSGIAPASGCESQADLDKTAQIPYSANYSFYRASTQ